MIYIRRGSERHVDMTYKDRYLAEEIAKYGPIPEEKPDTRTLKELETLRNAIFAALDRRTNE